MLGCSDTPARSVLHAARGCGQYYHSFFSMHPHYWHYFRTPKMKKARLNINGTRKRFGMDPTRTLEPRSLHRPQTDSRFDPFSLSCKKASEVDGCAPEPSESGRITRNSEMKRLEYSRQVLTTYITTTTNALCCAALFLFEPLQATTTVIQLVRFVHFIYPL